MLTTTSAELIIRVQKYTFLMMIDARQASGRASSIMETYGWGEEAFLKTGRFTFTT